jgi:hypothetical protein
MVCGVIALTATFLSEHYGGPQFVTTMAAAGIKASFEDLPKLGWQPVAMLAGETLFIAGSVRRACVAVGSRKTKPPVRRQSV